MTTFSLTILLLHSILMILCFSKNLIIKKFKLDCDYVDLEFLHDKPIRGFGK